MAVNNLYLFADDYIAKYGKERKERRHRSLTVDNEKRDMVDFEAIGEVPYTGAAFVRVGYDDDFMAAVDQFLLPLVVFDSRDWPNHR